MTCIVGLVDGDKVYIGGDSASADTGSYEIRQTTLPKVFRKGDFVIGYSWSFRMGQLLEHQVSFPELAKGQEYDMAYMVTSFIEECRRVFKDYGYAKIDSNKETGGGFLVAVNNKLFHVDCDFQVNQSVDGMDAEGCGSAYAYGSLYTSKGTPEERVQKALEASAYFSAYVCEPFKILST